MSIDCYTGWMKDDETPALPCADKLVFDSYKAAAASANVVHWQHGTTVKPYRCQHCKLWHLSSN